MAALTIRNLSDEIRNQLRIAAAKNGRSTEAEARAVLTDQFASNSGHENAEDIRQRLLRVQEDFAKHLPDRPRLSDEFLAERRRMWGEDD